MSFACSVNQICNITSSKTVKRNEVKGMSYSKQEYHMIWGARQLTLDDVLHALSLSFWHFINTIAYRLGRYKPSSPWSKELHGRWYLKKRCTHSLTSKPNNLHRPFNYIFANNKKQFWITNRHQQRVTHYLTQMPLFDANATTVK